MSSVIVGLDIGYSNVGIVSGPPGRPVGHCMPAGAGPIDLLPRALDGAPGSGYQVITTEGETWAAGVEPQRLQDWTRDLHADYPASETYRALLHAALIAAGHSHVAHLITGLPVSQYLDHDRRERLVEFLTGTHKISADFSVTIDSVSVMPQPAGGFMDFAANTADIELIDSGRILIIDPGFYSVDWVTLESGEMRLAASGSSAQAMSVLLAAADDLLFEEFGVRYGKQRIEQAIREKRHNVLLAGTKIDLTYAICKAAADTTARAMRDVSQSMRSDDSAFDLLLLVGGGAEFYEEAARRVFPNTRVQKVADPVGANARGFWTLGT